MPSTLRISANVNVGNDLPNGPHFKTDDGIELPVSNTAIAPILTQTTFSASESHFAHFDRRQSR
jgi:hypothetical protein